MLIQAQVLNLFEKLRHELGLSYLFIAHDLALVKQVSDRVAVMYLGKFCEVGPGESVYKQPLHPYTRRCSTRSRRPSPARADDDDDPRRAAVADQPAVRLPVPHPVPARRRALRGGGARAQGTVPGHLVACHFPLTEAVERTAAGDAPATQAVKPRPGRR